MGKVKKVTENEKLRRNLENIGETKPEALIDYSDEERTLSRTMMTFWANFAKTG